MSESSQRLVRELLNGFSLFRWDIQSLDENLHEEDLELVEDKFSFFNYVSGLLKSYGQNKNGNFEAALNALDEVEKWLTTLRRDENSRFYPFLKAFKHIYEIATMDVLLKSKKNEECFEMLDTITPFSDLNETDKAAIHAIRSACTAMYSFKGTLEAFDFIGRAIRKDPETPFWRFLKATYLYKLRTVLNHVDPPSLEEKDLFEKVNEEVEDDPLFMVYLADVYRESACSRNLRKLDFWFVPEESKKESKEEADEMCKKAKKLYEKAFERRPLCPKIAFRCANGLMKLPQQYHNVRLAKQIITNLSAQCKISGFGNFVSAFYHLKFGHKTDLTKEHLKAAMQLNVFNAHLNYVKLEFDENPKNFNVDKFNDMLKIFSEDPKRKIIYSQILSYHLFADKRASPNLKLVCDNFENYLKIGGPRNSLEHHRSLFCQTSEVISLLDVVIDEVKFALNNPRLDQNLREYLNKFVHSMNFHNISFGKDRPQNIRKQILDGKVIVPKPRCLMNSQPRRAPNAGRGQQTNRPATHSNVQQRNVPVSQQRNAPVSKQRNAPGSQQRNAPGSQQQNAPASQQRNAPASQQRNVPVSQQRSVPVSQQQNAPRFQGKNARGPENKAPAAAGGDVVRKAQDSRDPPAEEAKHREDEGRKERRSYDDEYRSRRRRSSRDRHDRRRSYSSRSSSPRRHGKHRKHRRRSSTSSSDDSYDRRGRRHGTRRRSESSDSYDRHGRRHGARGRSESSDSYDRHGRRHRARGRSESSDSYDRHSRRHRRRRSKEHRRSHDKRRRGRRYSSSSDTGSSSEYSRHEEKSRRRTRGRSRTPDESASSDYEKKKSSRRPTRDPSPGRRHKMQEIDRDLTKKVTDMTLGGSERPAARGEKQSARGSKNENHDSVDAKSEKPK